ncbi:hypothetical protein RM844_07350 [Streptomyces sp. DSM 44915]|uniref:Transcriptional regulator n=1 Tax=Streptomyces chisholmiae TaxID=3075540 RepID=A0ABU2JM96_9ACTN|nr:hypothetical protein [Streptomyces sp. DSM 44915]MDT0266110.1 hypothetical protein [Streptomyces sp. DSM 44915]
MRASLTVRQLSRWETGDPPPLPQPAQQQLLEVVLGAPLEELGFVVPPHRRTSRSRGGGDTGRQDVVRGGPGGGPGVLSDSAGRVGGAVDVAGVRDELAALYRMADQRGGVPAQARAAALGRYLTQALDAASLPPSVIRDLEAALAELACHRAWCVYDYDTSGAAARVASLEAVTTTQLTGHPLLQVRALGGHALVAMRSGRVWEARSAVERAGELARAAGAGPAVHRVIALREAGAATRAGDQAVARRALSRAVYYHARADRDQEDVPVWAGSTGQVEIDYATAAWHRRDGQPARAVPFLRNAVSAAGAGHARNAALYRSRLALTLLEAREVEEACGEIGRVLDGAGEVVSGRLRARLAEFAAVAAATGAAVVADPVDRIRERLRAAV